MPGYIYFIIKLLPYVAVCALIGGFIGWYLRCKIGKCNGHSLQAVAAPTQAKPSADAAARTKKLQEKLKQAEVLNVTLKNDLDSLKTKSVSISEKEVSQGDISAATAELAQEKERIAALTANLKKAQETIISLNAKLNVDVKEQKDRTFLLENELSQVREQLQRFQGSTDDSADLRSELDRAREMAANATRFAGESRKREALLTDENETLKAKLAKLAQVAASATVTAAHAFAASIPAKPVGDSEAVIKAKAEVARLNALKAAADKAAHAKSEAEHLVAERSAAQREIAAVVDAVDDAPATAEKIEHATDVLDLRVRQDDLKIIEGIEQEVEELLHGSGITTWAQLGEASIERVQEILNAAGDAYAVLNPATWPRQAAMAAAGQWSQLREWHDQLAGKKEVS